jgi:hypothetical protein
MRKQAWTLGLLAAAVAGCGTDVTVPNEAQLSEAEASYVVDQSAEISYNGFMGFLGGLGITGRPASEVNLQNAPFDVVRQCTFEGTVRKHGTVTGTRSGQFPNVSLTINAAGHEVFADCVLPTGLGSSENPVTIKINGQLETTLMMKREGREFVDAQRMTRKGTITFATSDGRSGTCEINYTMTINPDNRARTVQGQVCGRAVNETRPLWRATNGL